MRRHYFRLRVHRAASVVALVTGLASANGCAYRTLNARMCSEFRVHSGPAAFSIRSNDEVDVAPLVRRLQPGQVVAVGEGTHGTHEYQRFQALVMQALVEDLGYTGVAIEGVGAEALWINDYICGKGVPFSPFVVATEEYYDAIDWLRAYNKERGFESCVEVIPFDPHHGGRAPIVYALTTLETKNIGLGVSEDVEACLVEWIGRDAAEHDPCRATAAMSLEQFLTTLGRDFSDLREAARFARDEAIVAGDQHPGRARDYFMAANILAALDDHPNGIVVWAHDGHVSEGPINPRINRGNGNGTMGILLSRAIGHRYVSIGQLSQGGTAMVLDYVTERFVDSAFRAKHHFFENLVGADTAVDLRELVPGTPAWDCAMGNHYVAWLGAGPGLGLRGDPIVPGASFDLVVVLGQTTSAHRPKRPRMDQTD